MGYDHLNEEEELSSSDEEEEKVQTPKKNLKTIKEELTKSAKKEREHKTKIVKSELISS